MSSRIGAALCALALAAGCANKLPKATLITKMRILGAQIEVASDPTRASPKPGESFTLGMDTVFANPLATTDAVHSMFVGCTGPDRFTGSLPICQEFLDAAQAAGGADVSGVLSVHGKVDLCQDGSADHYTDPTPRVLDGVSLECKKGDPVASLSVPDDFKAKDKLMLGVVCELGFPYVDPTNPQLFGCSGQKGATIPVNALVPVEHDASEENHNPNLSNFILLMDPGDVDGFDPKVVAQKPGETDAEQRERLAKDAPSVWLPDESTAPSDSDASIAGAASATVGCPSNARVLDLAPNHRIGLLWRAAGRERVGATFENLELSIYATDGKLQRRFTLFQGDQQATGGYLRDDVGWDPPAKSELDAGKGKAQKSKLISFFITVRDGRGGFAATTRLACVSGGSAQP